MASLLQTIAAYAKMARQIYRQNKAATSALCTELNIEATYHKRIGFYTTQSAITNHWFCTLRGQKPTQAEQRKALLIGAITPLLDDAVDDLHLTSTKLLQALNDANQVQFALPAKMYRELISDQNHAFTEAFKTALQAQDASLKQLQEPELTDQELIAITAAKGGSWTFLYRTVLGHPILKGEKEAIYELGYLMQLTNDAFDVYKDLQNGQQTLFTNAVEIEPLKAIYLDQLDKIKATFQTLNYNRKNTQYALLAMSAIGARGLVCIDQLLACQHFTNGAFRLHEYSRKQLICDMEKPANIWKTMQYSKRMFA